MSFFEIALARILIYCLAYVVAVMLGHFLVREVILRRHRRAESGGLEGAGATIGCLERVLTLTLVLLGEYEALALIIAAKSIARFQELKRREFGEYYLIGTLSSMSFAVLVGILASWLLEFV